MKLSSEENGRTPLTLTTFPGVKKTRSGERYDYESMEDMYLNVFSEHTITPFKHKLPVYVFGEFFDAPAHRSDRNVKHLCGLILDIDNDYLDKNNNKRIVDNPLTFDDVINTLCAHHLQFIAHTSHSHLLAKEEYAGAAVPKIRVIIPFDKPLSPPSIPSAFNVAHGLFDFRPGIDSCGKRVSQPYYAPSCPVELQSEARHHFSPGKPLCTKKIETQQSQHESKPTKNRKKQNMHSHFGRSYKGKKIDLPDWLEAHELNVSRVKEDEEETIYVLETCPINEDHDDSSAAIGQRHTGEIWFRCHHNGCANMTWSDVWKTLDDSLYSNPKKTFSELTNLAGKVNESDDSLDFLIDQLVVSDLSEVKKERIRKIAATAIGSTVKAITNDYSSRQKDHAEKNSSNELSAEKLATKTLSNVGRMNILFSDSDFWTWQESGVWKKRQREAVRQLLHEQARIANRTISKEWLDCAFDILRTDCYREDHEFNIDNGSINFTNCELRYDDDSGIWTPCKHSRENYNITQIPHEYNPDAKAKRFSQFLREITANDNDADDKMMLLLQLIGYCLLSTAKYETFFILTGDGANGKSVFLYILRELLGIQNVCAVNIEDLASNHYRAQLHGKSANIVSEIAEGVILPEAPIKAIVSGELITADHKYGHPFSFRPFCKLVFATNHLPHTRDYSDAIYRRVKIIPFTRKFELHEQDPDLCKTLTLEIPGIINLSLAALRNFFIDGRFVEPESVTLAERDWRLNSDQVQQFVEECCFTERDGKSEHERTEFAQHTEKSGKVYAAYREWARSNNIRRLVAHKTLTERLKQFGVVPYKSPKRGTRLLKGVKLKSGLVLSNI